MTSPVSLPPVPSLDELVAALRAHPRRELPPGRLRPAAVLVPLLCSPEGFELLFTLRPSTLSSHAGQVSFPGGRVDPGDEDRWATALREAEEEVAIPGDAVRRVAMLDDLRTITGYHVTPCVGLVDPAVPIRAAAGEVAEVFTVPLDALLDPARVRRMHIGRGGHAERIHFYLTRPHVVWGATAAIVAHLLEVIAPGRR